MTTDGKFAVSGSGDKPICVWNLASGECIRKLKGHSATVYSIKLSPDNHWAVSGAGDRTIRIWDMETGKCCQVLTGHKNIVYGVDLSEDRSLALSGSGDKTMKLWDVETGFEMRTFSGHTGSVEGVMFSPNYRYALSCSSDTTLRYWNVRSGQCVRVFEGHSDAVHAVAMSPDGRHAISASGDKTLRIWDLMSGQCLYVFRGHEMGVYGVSFSPSGLATLSASWDRTIRLWDLSEFVAKHRAPQITVPLSPITPVQVHYTNAKVLLVGESGVGKTGLSNYLAHGIKVEDAKPLPSTDGAWATHWPLRHDQKEAGVEREIWLWDFAGQVDYRLVHQLFMDDTAAAVLVFNPQNENPFEGLGHWDRDLQKAARKPFAKLLLPRALIAAASWSAPPA